MFCCKFIEYCLNLLHPQLFGKLAKLPLIIQLPPDDIELGTTTATFWINLVTLSCSGQSTAFMKQSVLDFCLKRIVRTSYTKHLSSRCALRIRIATLNHKVLYHSMEQSAVIITLLCQFKEVVTMDGSLII